MLPVVSSLINIEMLRDGGSLAASFKSDRGREYTLLLRIDIDKKEHRRLGYRDPVLIDCDPKLRPPNTDRVIYSSLCGPAVPVSWSEACEITTAVSPLAIELDSWQTVWLAQMVYVTTNDGRLPPDMDLEMPTKGLGNM